MKFTLHILILSSLLLSSSLTHAEVSSDTEAYIAALAQLLEQKTIGDAELVTILEAAEDGKIVNPISPLRAETSVEHFVANNALEELLQGKIDAARVAAWAKENIKEQHRVRKQRKETQDETKALWEAETSVLSMSHVHSCFLKADGIIKCWGRPNGKIESPSGFFQSVSAGDRDTCAVTIDGAVECWGEHFYGQERIRSKGFRSISLQAEYACGLKVDASVECWSTWNNRTKLPTRPLGAFQSISTGTYHACGIKIDSTVACWGDNRFDQSTPPAGDFQSVSAGSFYTCGVRSNGAVECWGENGEEQASPPSGVFLSVSSGTHHTCGVKTDGVVECWGKNNWIKSAAPSGSFRSISAGERHNCGIKTNGAVECWGNNDHCQTLPPRSLRYPWLASYIDLDQFPESPFEWCRYR